MKRQRWEHGLQEFKGFFDLKKGIDEHPTDKWRVLVINFSNTLTADQIESPMKGY